MPGFNSRSQSGIPVWLSDDDGGLLGTAATPLRAATTSPATTASGALSGTLTNSGDTVIVPFVNTARQEVLNPSTATLWARWGGAPAVNGAGSFAIAPNGSYAPGSGVAGTLQLLSTAAAQPYTVNRFA